jgi:hypothetical protein
MQVHTRFGLTAFKVDSFFDVIVRAFFSLAIAHVERFICEWVPQFIDEIAHMAIYDSGVKLRIAGIEDASLN